MRKKGIFSKLDLEIASKYVYPRSRKWILLVGGIIALALVILVLGNVVFSNASLLSNGPLSSGHAAFAKDCAQCHTGFAAVTDSKCATCHEKYGDETGIYTFNAHYLYRSGDYNRVHTRDNEKQCFACHLEHQGKTANLTDIPDSQCLICHDYKSFNHNHPQFDFIAESIADNSGLTFSHIPHVQELQKRYNIIDIERTCLTCHQPQADGKRFQAIDFEQSCSQCHLQPTESTLWLPVKTSSNEPGVETLAALKVLRELGSHELASVDAGIFRTRGSQIQKSFLQHKDPWILANLRLLRQQIFPDLGLADLLITTGEFEPDEAKNIYREALQNLKAYTAGLRLNADNQIQSELGQIDNLMRFIEKKLVDPKTILDDSKWQIIPNRINPGLTPTLISEYETLITDLTQPCRKCHAIKHASIVRVQKDQRILARAEFNHQAHIIQRRCLDCHSRIQFPEFGQSVEEIDRSSDQAVTQNIPGIETCQSCHNQNASSNRCITCHAFHPDKTRYTKLLLYAE